MESLQQILGNLRDHLSKEHGFTEMPASDLMTAARMNAMSVYPAQLFLEWLRRVPEVSEFLELRGVFVEETKLIAPDIKARFQENDKYQHVRVLNRRGQLYQIHEIIADESIPRIGYVGIEAFDPDCREHVKRLTRNFPEAGTQLVWDDGQPVGESEPLTQ